MKPLTHIFLFVALVSVLVACGSDDDNGTAPVNAKLGTYAGYIQVVDDPQTDLGYILNAKVSVDVSGSVATVKITGDPGFDREFTGTVNSHVQDTYDITLTKQTKPTEKTAGDRVIISNNKLTVSIDVANDKVTLRDEPTNAATFELSGKLSMIGTDLLKE